MVSLNKCTRPRHVGTWCDTQEGILEWGLLGLVSMIVDGEVETQCFRPTGSLSDTYEGTLEWGLLGLWVETGLAGGVSMPLGLDRL